MPLDLSSLKKAVASLKNALEVVNSDEFSALSKEMQILLQAGVIQNFEFTYELCWKFMKRYLSDQLGSSMVDGVSRTELFRLGIENRLISDVAKWRSYHEYRNLTSHVYDENVAAEIFAASKDFIIDAKNFLDELEKRNKQEL